MSPPPWIFGVLGLPHGVFLGFVTIVLPYLLAQSSIPIDQIAQITTLASLPWLAYFLWSPLVDRGLRRRTWLAMTATLVGVFSAAAIVLSSANHAVVLMLCAGGGAFAASLVLAASGGLAIVTLPGSGKGRAAAFYEAGKLAGSAFGGAALLSLAQHLHSLELAACAALLIAFPGAFALTIPEPSAPSAGPFRRLGDSIGVMRDIFKSRPNRWSALLLASPIGTGSAIALLPALARDYDVKVQQVIWVNGVGGGFALAAGAVCGALMPGHWKRHMTYVVAGALNAISAAFLFSSPQPLTYAAGTLLYLVTTGLCWARFAALVTAVVGTESPSVSTRFSVVAAIGNIPLLYMLLLDGACAKYAGLRGMLWMESGGNLVACMVFVCLFSLRRRLSSLDAAYAI